MNSDLYIVFQYGIVATSVVLALIVIVAAFRSGAITEVRFGSFAFKASSTATQEGQKFLESIKASAGSELPFETEQLAKYYGEVLAQSKTSFWFSLVFAVIGFLVIIVAAFTFSGKQDSTVWIQIKQMCESIEDPIAKDALKVQLSLYYSGIPDAAKVSESIVREWLQRNTQKVIEPNG